MRSMMTALLFCVLLIAGACSDRAADTETAVTEPSATAAAKDLTPEELGELGANIEKDPDNAKNLLSAKGLDEQSFEAAIRRVSEDPDASKRYTDAYNRARA